MLKKYSIKYMFFVFFGAYLYSCTVFAEGINPNDRTNIAGNQELLKLQSIQESTRYVAPEAFLNWLKSKRFFLILTRAFKDTNDYVFNKCCLLYSPLPLVSF